MEAPLWFSPSFEHRTPWTAVQSKVVMRSGIQYAHVLDAAGKTVTQTFAPTTVEAYDAAQLICHAVNDHMARIERVGQFAETIASVKQYEFSPARFYAVALCFGGLALLVAFSTFIPATLHQTLLTCAGAWFVGIVAACAVELVVRRG